MTPLEFLAAVLPRTGYYCIAELTSPQKQHVFTKTLEEAYAKVEEFDALEYDVYFATSSFNTPENRKAENAKNTRSLFVDLDCGENKSFASKKAATASLQNLVQRAGLPDPYVVSSGNGIHAYWAFEDEASIHEATTLANKFKRLCMGEAERNFNGQHVRHAGALVIDEPNFFLGIDAAVTGDSTRLLRVPGTRNWKRRTSPKPVQLLLVGETVEYSRLLLTVEALLPPEEALPDLFSNLGTAPKNVINSALHELNIQNSKAVFADIEKAGCKQIDYYLANAAKDGMEPLWRGVLSITRSCTDKDEASPRISQLHPYSEQRMWTKLNEIKGPYPCTKFESDNPGLCGTCSHRGRITSPIQLGSTIGTTVEEKVIEKTEVVELIRPKPPKGFGYGDTGGIYEVIEENVEQGIPERKTIILPYDIFVVDLLSTESRHIVNFAVVRHGRVQNISIPQKSIVSRDETLKALSEQNILASNKMDTILYRFIRGSVEDASFHREPITIPASCGWQDDNSFVFDQRVFTDKGEKTFPMPGLENVFKSSRPTGTLDNWRAIINMLIGRGEHEILAMSLVGFGAPLMRFGGLYGMTFHLGSTESGTGKTLAIELAASVWGDPVKSRTTIDTSNVATLNRLGLLGSLPLCTDEITAKNRADFEWLPTFLFSVTEGHGKERMESGANRERINTTYWQSLVLLSSNTHVMDYLTGARKHSSEGEIRRILELTLSKPMDLLPGDVELIKSLRQNYSVAGERYVRWLVKNIDTVKLVIKKTYDTLYEEFDATNDERFWIAGCTAIVAGGVLAGRNYANVVDYPLVAITGVLKNMVQNARAMAKDSLRTAEDILNAFIRQYYGKFVVIRKVEGRVMAKFGGGADIDESITRSDVMGRVEHLTSGFVDFFIEEPVMRTFCASMSFGYADFKRHLSKKASLKTCTKNLLAYTKGPPMVVKAIQLTRKGEIEFEQEPVAGDT